MQSLMIFGFSGAGKLLIVAINTSVPRRFVKSERCHQ
jgi:hypothetical protein